jgi:hypothetical protein
LCHWGFSLFLCFLAWPEPTHKARRREVFHLARAPAPAFGAGAVAPIKPVRRGPQSRPSAARAQRCLDGGSGPARRGARQRRSVAEELSRLCRRRRLRFRPSDHHSVFRQRHPTRHTLASPDHSQ